jgi:hypothetical protein
MRLKLNDYTHKEYYQLADKVLRVHSSLTIEDVDFYHYHTFSFASIRHLSLEFCFVQSVQNVKRLVDGLPNLESFKFRPSIYEKVLNNAIPSDKPSPSAPKTLKYFEIFLYPTVADSENAWNVMRCFELVPMKIQNIELHLLSVYDDFQAENLTRILGYIDENHGENVKKLTFLYWSLVPKVYEHLARLQKVQLDELEICGSSIEDCAVLTNFLQGQKSLKKMKYVSKPMLPRAHLVSICEHLQNLTTLELDCGMLTEIFLDQLTKLEDLQLSFYNPVVTVSITIPEGLRNLVVTPKVAAEVVLSLRGQMKNMQKLRLKNCIVTPINLEEMATNMPNLKTCELFIVNNRSPHPISTYTLPWKNLRKLVLPSWMMDDAVLLTFRCQELETFNIVHDFGMV